MAYYGLFFETGGMKRGHLLAVYEGGSCDSLGNSYQTAMKRWQGSEYVLSNSAHRFVVNGALTCGAVKANESFGDANCFLYFNRSKRRVELRLAADIPGGFYEAFLVNYTPPHQASSFWTEDRILLLPEETRRRARKFYCDSEDQRSPRLAQCATDLRQQWNRPFWDRFILVSLSK